MKTITEKPLITVKTINARIFEQIPEAKPEERKPEDELLGIVRCYALLYRKPSGNLYFVHWVGLTDAEWTQLKVNPPAQIFIG